MSIADFDGSGLKSECECESGTWFDKVNAVLCLQELFPGTFQPTPAHFFMKLLHDKGLLLRCFTQNIDSLENQAGLDKEQIVAAHGNFDSKCCTLLGHVQLCCAVLCCAVLCYASSQAKPRWLAEHIHAAATQVVHCMCSIRRALCTWTRSAS